MKYLPVMLYFDVLNVMLVYSKLNITLPFTSHPTCLCDWDDYFYTSPKCTNNLLFVCWMKTPHGYWDDTWLTQIPMFNYMSIDWSTGCDERYCFILMLTQLTLSLWLLMDGLRIIFCYYPIHEMYETHMTQIIWYMVELHSNAEFLFK